MFKKIFLLFLVSTIALSACGTLEVTIKQTPVVPPDSLNYFRNFRVISDTPGELIFSVDYNYSGDKGDIMYGAGCLDEGQRVSCVETGADHFQPYHGASSGTLIFHLGLYGPDPRTTDQIYVGMYAWGPGDLIAYQDFDYRKQWTVVLPTPTTIPSATPLPPPTTIPSATPLPPPTSKPASLPDLVISSMYLEMEGRQGNCVASYAPYEIRVVVENIGFASTGPFAVDLNGARQWVDEGLAAGRAMTLHFSGTLPSGRYEALADASNQVVEYRDDNNSSLFYAPTPTPPFLCTPTATPIATP